MTSRRPSSLPAVVVLAAGLVFSLCLQMLIPGEVFTTGDAGLKALMTRQFSEGTFRLDLQLPVEPWARELWEREELYPFTYPNVVARGGKRYVAYSPAFPLASAPFYRAFGFRGLYVLPLVSTWLVWIFAARLCRGLDLDGAACAAALVSLIFASPLTFYSATFWEHAPAVALAFAGVTLATSPRTGAAGGSRRLFVAGALVGLASFFREEHIVLAGLLLLLELVGRPPAPEAPTYQRPPVALVGGLLASLALFFGVNLVLYGHPLGLHGGEAIATSSSTVARSAEALRYLLGSLFEHFPLVGFTLVTAPLIVSFRAPGSRSALFLLGLAAAFCVIVPVLVRAEGGRQWGPRFLLVVVPMLSVASGLALQDARRLRSQRYRVAVWLLFLATAGWGVWVNTGEGTRYLWRNYQARIASHRRVMESPLRYVAVSHESIAQQLAGAFGEKTFFLTTRGKDLRALARALVVAGHAGFLYICYPQYPCGPFDEQPASLRFYIGSAPFIEFSRLDGFERYVAYEARILLPLRRLRGAPDPSAEEAPTPASSPAGAPGR